MNELLIEGDRIRLKRTLTRYPHFTAHEGMTGTVVDECSADLVCIRMDDHLPGAEDWNNEICFTPEDDLDGEQMDARRAARLYCDVARAAEETPEGGVPAPVFEEALRLLRFYYRENQDVALQRFSIAPEVGGRWIIAAEMADESNDHDEFQILAADGTVIQAVADGVDVTPN